MKIWKPDTCECEIEEVYNGNEIIGGGQVLKKCAVHQSVPDQDLYGVLYANPDGENKLKNSLLKTLLGYEEVKGLGLEEAKINQDGSDGGIGLKKGLEYEWSFEGEGANRTLKWGVKGANLTQEQIDSVDECCKTKFGVDKVKNKLK